MVRNKSRLVGILPAVIVLLAACGPAVTPAPKTAATGAALAVHEGSEWVLNSLRGERLLEGTRITLNFGKDGFDGVAGCNNYGGGYSIDDGGRFSPTEVFLTAIACSAPEGAMEQEKEYIQALGSARNYRQADGLLELADDGGETVLVFRGKEAFDTDPGALVGTSWRLVSVDGEGLSADAVFGLVFYSASIMDRQTGCRDYLATYQASGDNLNVLFEAMFDTACGSEGYEDLGQEGPFLDVTAPKADLRLVEGRLEVHGERGAVLVFEPQGDQVHLDLEGTTWSLLATIGPNPYVEEPEPWPMADGLLLGTTIDLALEGGTVQGSAGCNSYGGAFVHAGSSLSIDGLHATERACLDPAGIMEEEAHYLELLAAVSSYQIYGDRLWLETGDGQALFFWASGP
jgi:heat shock protein HslJ